MLGIHQAMWGAPDWAAIPCGSPAPAGWLPCAIPWWPAPSPCPPGSRCRPSRSRCSRWASPRSRRSWLKSGRRCWWRCWGCHCSGWETRSHSGTWGCCHQASHEAEENVGFFPPRKKSNQHRPLQEGAGFTDTEFFRILYYSYQSPSPGKGVYSGTWISLCSIHWDSELKTLLSSQPHSLYLFCQENFFKSWLWSLYSPHAAAPVSPIPTDALEWGCHPWASNLPGSLLPSHRPQKYPGLSSSSSAFLSSKKHQEMC